MTSYTPNLDLAKQDTGAQGWGAVLNQNFDKIDTGFGEVGVKVYSATITYASGEFVIASVDDTVGLYKSLQGNNVGHSLTDTTWWEAVPLGGGGASRNVGEKVISTIPLEDAGLHLLDGSLIQGSGAYADFVDYMADLYDNIPRDRKVYNVSIVGNLVNTDGVLSGFSASNYAELPEIFDTGDNSWEVVLKVKTGNSLSSNENVIGDGVGAGFNGLYIIIYNSKWALGISSNGSSWDIADASRDTGQISVATNTDYYLKASWDGSQYKLDVSTDGTTYQNSVTINSATKKIAKLQSIGCSAYNAGYQFNGTIDLNESYIKINGDFWWQGVTYENEIFCSESNWFRSVNLYGSCSKFVYDEVGNTVRLPKRASEHGELIKSYINGTEWYRIYSDGWCEQGGYSGASGSGNSSNARVIVSLLIPYRDTNYKAFAECSANGGSAWAPRSASAKDIHSFYNDGWTTGSSTITVLNWWASGYIDTANLLQEPLYEYICIATTTNTQVEIDINQVMTDVNAKVDKGDLTSCRVVIETYINGTEWYRLYDDGWCEQGGYYTGTTDNWTTISFLKPYVDIPNVSMNRIGPAGDDGGSMDRRHCMIRGITSSGFNCWGVWAGYKFVWHSCGYAAQENG